MKQRLLWKFEIDNKDESFVNKILRLLKNDYFRACSYLLIMLFSYLHTHHNHIHNTIPFHKHLLYSVIASLVHEWSLPRNFQAACNSSENGKFNQKLKALSYEWWRWLTKPKWRIPTYKNRKPLSCNLCPMESSFHFQKHLMRNLKSFIKLVLLVSHKWCINSTTHKSFSYIKLSLTRKNHVCEQIRFHDYPIVAQWYSITICVVFERFHTCSLVAIWRFILKIHDIIKFKLVSQCHTFLHSCITWFIHKNYEITRIGCSRMPASDSKYCRSYHRKHGY